MTRRTLQIASASILIFLLFMSAYSVGETEQVVITQFGEIVGNPHIAPGLHFRIPFVDEVHSFEKRWLEWDGSPNQIPTRDKKYIWVDAYARWRISDPIKFYKRLRDEVGAQSRLDDIIDGEIRNVIANHNLNEIVRSTSRTFQETDETADEQSDNMDFSIREGRDKLTTTVIEKSSSVMPEYGIELADMQIKRLNYVDSVQQKVFERMISERKRIAERYRSEGQGRSAEIMGRIDKELKTIQSEAYRQASETRGKADAEAARIYADAYNKNPEFYKFTKTLDAYPSLIDSNTQVILSTDADVLKLMKNGQ
jgi:membrane protease subunit HflC